MTDYTLSFELRPDSTPTDPGASDFTRCSAILNGNSLGLFVSDPQGGGSCNCGPQWKPFSVDVTAHFDPETPNHLQLAYVFDGVEGHALDRAHWRRIRITGDDGSIYYGEYPAGFPYTAALQDGIAGSDACGGECLEMASHGEEPASQWSAEVDDFVTPEEGTGSIHLYFSAADVVGGGTPEAWDVYDADALLGDPIATLQHAKGRWIRSPLHELGEGGFTINRHASEATEAILAEGNMIKVRIEDCGPDYLDGFFIPGDGDYALLSAQGGKGAEDLVFKGPGALSYLDRARMTPCAFSIPPDVVGTWGKVWVTKAVGHPGGVAFDPDEAGFIYVGGVRSRKIKKVDQSTLEVVSSSPALWSGTNRYLGGISFDPDDDTIVWALVIPWLAGSSANTQIKKIRRSDWEVLNTYDLGDDVKLTDIRVDGDFVWTTRYDNDRIQQRSKSNPTTIVDSFTITYKGKLQKKPNGLAINGTNIAYWFGGDGGGGTDRALIADTSDPDTITDVQRTNGIEGFGGEWTTEGGEQFLYVVSYTAGKTWKYQLTDAIPACADDSGVFHPEQVAPGALAWRVLVEITHVDRPSQPCPELSFDFSEELDSNGTPWPARTSTEEFTWQVGDRAFSDVLARLIPAGVTFDLDVNTMTLHAYIDADFGTDRTSSTFAAGKVRFAEGVNLGVNGDLNRRDNRGQPDTYITVLGDAGVYGTAALAGRYVREGFMQVSGPTTSEVLDAIGDDELARQRLVSDALGFETLWANAELVGKYIPKKHYWKGDLVTVDMVAGDFAYDEEEVRVYGTLITERDGGWRSALDLGSAYKIPPPVDSVPGEGKPGDGGAGSSRGTTVITSIPLTVGDGDGISIPRVTRILMDGVTSPEPGVAQLPSATASGDTPVLEELLTDETDPTLVYSPDAGGGVTGRAETPDLDHGALGAAATFDPADAGRHIGELDDDVTITLPEPGVSRSFMEAVLTQDGTGGHSVTIAAGAGASFVWDGGIAPDMPTDPDTTFRLLFDWIPAISTWVGNMTGSATSASGDPADDTAAWMPLTTYVGDDLVLVADGPGGGPIPTLVPIT